MNGEIEESDDLRAAISQLLDLPSLSDLRADLALVASVLTDKDDRRLSVRLPDGVQFDDAIWVGTGRPRADATVLLFWRESSLRRFAVGASILHSSVVSLSDFFKVTIGLDNPETGFQLECDDTIFTITRRTSQQTAVEIGIDGTIEIGKPSKREKALLGETTVKKIKDIFDGLRSRPISIDVLTGPEMMEPSTSAWLSGEIAGLDECLSEDLKHG